MRLDSKHLGSVRLMTTGNVVAGSMETIRFLYRAGRYGIDDRGSLILAWRSVSDMQVPQFARPQEAGYASVSSTADALIVPSYMKFVRPYINSIKIEVPEGYLRENDELEIVFGDTSHGSPGIRMQSFYEREFEFVPLIDPCGTQRYERMPDILNLEIQPAHAEKLEVVAPTLVEPGEQFVVALRALDRYGNIALDKIGEVSLYSPGITPEDGAGPHTTQFQAGNTGVVHVPGFKFNKKGTYYICARDHATGQIATSNACVAVEAPMKRFFWGDMHGQTRETLGAGRLDDYLAFARDSALISFTSWQGNDFEISDSAWNDVRAMVKQFNEEGRFLVYLGYEWSGGTNAGGDHNVFFLGDSETFYPSSNWLAPGRADHENNAFPITELHERFRGRQDVMLTPHIGGRPCNLDFYNSDLIQTIEIHSHHGIFDWFALEGMKRRLKVGFLATSDDHHSMPGMSYPSIIEGGFSSSLWIRGGLTGVFADELTKDNIWDALKRRHCYASTLDRLYLDTHIGGYMMGDEFSVPVGKQVINIKAAGNDVIDAVFVYDWDKLLKRVDMMPKCENALRISFSGVATRNREKEADWTGGIEVSGGKIRNVSRCGHTLAPWEPVLEGDRKIVFKAKTNGEMKGFVLDMEMDDKTAVKVDTVQGNFDFTFGQLKNAGRISKMMGGVNLVMEADFANLIPQDEAERLSRASCEMAYELPAEQGEHAYWVKVILDNGEAAWSSPMFVEQTGI